MCTSQWLFAVIVEGDAAVSCLVFLETRSEKQNSASLIANGPKGMTSFFTINISWLFAAASRCLVTKYSMHSDRIITWGF